MQWVAIRGVLFKKNLRNFDTFPNQNVRNDEKTRFLKFKNRCVKPTPGIKFESSLPKF